MDISKELRQKVNEAMNAVPDLVAELAVDYFKERFRYKEFDGKKWPGPGQGYKRANGSLLVDSGHLLNSIRPAEVSARKVVISAGNDDVLYAKVHNEGFSGSVVVKAHDRTGKKGKRYVVKQHTRKALIPQRQFMGESRELNSILKKDIEQLFKSIIEE